MPSGKPPRLDLNPSSADRWTTCTASPRFIMENWDKLPPGDTIYNQAGTAAHEVASAYLQDREPGTTPVPVDEDMLWHGWNYQEYVLGLKEPRAILTVERKYPNWYMPERNAMIDAAVLNPRNLHIIDYKYGEGIPVSPVENLQGSIYARDVIESFDKGGLSKDFPVTIHIYQPRGRNSEDGPAHTWQTSWGELREFTEERVSKAAAKILWDRGTDMFPETGPILKFAPSDKACQWCPAKGFCAARLAHLTGEIDVLSEFTVVGADAPDLPLAHALSTQQRAAIQTHAPELIKWLKDVLDYNAEVFPNDPLPGFKLVLSRGGNRAWSDPKKALELLLESTILKKEEIVEEKAIGPAAVEKLLGKNKLSADLMNLIVKPPGSPVIAPEGDKREAITSDASTDFAPIEDSLA